MGDMQEHAMGKFLVVDSRSASSASIFDKRSQNVIDDRIYRFDVDFYEENLVFELESDTGEAQIA